MDFARQAGYRRVVLWTASALDIPVILVTGHHLALARQEARDSRVNISAYRRKPVSLPDLAALVETLAGDAAPQPEGNPG